MATRSSFESMLEAEFRAIFNGRRGGENPFAAMAKDAAKAAEGLLGSRFDPERRPVPPLALMAGEPAGRAATIRSTGPDPMTREDAEGFVQILNRYELARSAFQVIAPRAPDRRPEEATFTALAVLLSFFQIEEGGE